jgi:RNA polymerase sigma-70 factor, ECF subfamily
VNTALPTLQIYSKVTPGVSVVATSPDSPELVSDPIRYDAELRMEFVFVTYSRPLMRFLLSLTRYDRQAAEDLLQETMLRAWRRLDSMPSAEENARRWLFTVARRVAIDAARMRQVRPTHVNLLEAGNVAVEDTSDSALAMHSVVEAFRRLSVDHRNVLTELYLRGRSVEEAAERLGVPRGTVKSRAHYAMQELKSSVDGGADEAA